MTDLVGRLLGRIREERHRVLVIGDAIVDVWVHGALAECQDGCPKFVQSGTVRTPGGAANAHNCLSYWGPVAELYAASLPARPVKTRFVVATGTIVFRHDDEKFLPPEERAGCKWSRDRALEMVSHAHAVLLSDYDKGFLSPEFIGQVIDLCKQRGIPCVADCKREPGLYEGCVRKCNQDYARKYWGVVNARWNRDAVVTRGFYSPQVNGSVEPNMPPVPCANHVGAGDCFGAHLTLALAYGFSLADAAALAHSAGRVYVQSQHNRPPRPEEIAADMAGAILQPGACSG